MASITSMLNEYRIPSVFHPDSGTTVHTVHELDDIPANTQRPGRIETRWKQETQLGSGAFASVRLEKNELTGQLRAVKLIPKDVLDQCDIDYEHELDILVAVKDVGIARSCIVQADATLVHRICVTYGLV